MYLSICIPIYNTDIRPLAEELHRQIQGVSVEVELLFLDDASEITFRKVNRTVNQFCFYKELSVNVGRAKIRNSFKELAKGKYMLFLDGDSKIEQSTFLKNYCDFLTANNPAWVMGGRVDSNVRPKRKYLLRWTYSRARESKSFQDRLENKAFGFKSNNFIILRDLFEKFPFDESIRKYGHEDTLFGYILNKNGFDCVQIDNPVLNKDLDSNEFFLENTKHALSNLVDISEKLNDSAFDNQQVLLAKTKSLINSFGQKLLFEIFSFFIFPILQLCLKKGYFKLWMFDVYRLIVLFRILVKRADKNA